MSTRDSLTTLRNTSDGALTATTTYPLEINGTPLGGLSVCLIIPSTDSATDQSLSIYVHASTASVPVTTDQVVAQLVLPDITLNTLNENLFVLPFSTEKRSILLDLVVAGTSPSYGIVLAWVSEQLQATWDRKTDWHA